MTDGRSPKGIRRSMRSRQAHESTLAKVSNRDHPAAERWAAPSNDDRLLDMTISDLRAFMEDVIRDAMERQTMSDTSELLTTDQLAKLMKISPDTPRKWRRQGCPHVPVSERKLRWRLADVLRWREKSHHG